MTIYKCSCCGTEFMYDASPEGWAKYLAIDFPLFCHKCKEFHVAVSVEIGSVEKQMCDNCELENEKSLSGIKARLQEVRSAQRELEIEKRKLILEAEKIDPHWEVRLPDGSINPKAQSWPKEKPWLNYEDGE